LPWLSCHIDADLVVAPLDEPGIVLGCINAALSPPQLCGMALQHMAR
jgi:hypothetical protein